MNSVDFRVALILTIIRRVCDVGVQAVGVLRRVTLSLDKVPIK